MGKKLTTEEFIKRARKVHGDRYDYSKVVYVNASTKVCIICPEHGEFWQIPNSHLMGHGCCECSGLGRITQENFQEKAKKVHGDKYDYSKVEYIDSKTKVCIICPEHGEFWQTPKDHLSKRGCPKCGGNYHYTTEDFIKKAREIHGNKYDYSKVEYKGAHTKVCIICPEHGEFWQSPDNHYRWGCKKCQESSLEKKMKFFLYENSIVFEEQKCFDWLLYSKSMKLDFYLPDYNAAIECQGEQHFIPYRFKNTDEEIRFKIRKNRDRLKQSLCQINGVKLYYYANEKMPDKLNEYKVYKNINELITDIKNAIYETIRI